MIEYHFPYRQIYFIGIGGIGMSALARFFTENSLPVAGYDRVESPLTQELVHEGMNIHYRDNKDLIPEVFRSPETRPSTLVVYTPAVPGNHSELLFFRQSGYKVMKRSEVLGLISEHSQTIAVAGTHGKTSISTLTAHVLEKSGANKASFLGGISNNYGTNYLSGSGKWVVMEADEFDRSFLRLSPQIALISAMDADHLDIYGSHESLLEAFHEFASRVRSGGKIIYRNDLALNKEVNKGVSWYSYGIDGTADFTLGSVKQEGGYYSFDMKIPAGVLKDLRLGIPGRINQENALAAAALSWLAGVPEETIRGALQSYRGVRRRFDVRHFGSKYVYIDDYAHHPEEIKKTLTSIRELFPGKKITCAFQPHLYTRTRDFASEFANSLDRFDRVWMMEIYPAREEPLPGVDARMILSRMKLQDKALVTREELLHKIKEGKPEVMVTMGAGNIDRLVKPIEEIYKQIESDA